MPITPTSTIKYETEGRKAIITLTRPEAMNALNREILNAIGEAVLEYEADDNLLVAIITGEGGRAFSAGADLKEMTQRDQSEGVDAGGGGLNGFDQLDACRKPLIAAVDGYCLAGGLEVTIYCDMVVATEQSRFGLPEPRRSLLAGPGLHNLSRIIPYREAMLIQLTGGHMTSQRAYDIGLIQRLVPDRDAMWAAAHELADEILECAPLAVQAIKQIVKVGRPLPVEYSQKLAEPISAFIATTEDRLEGPKAFAEKRTPNWKMR
jgi:enoyl-CoA hydratase/carnithine racemase